MFRHELQQLRSKSLSCGPSCHARRGTLAVQAQPRCYCMAAAMVHDGLQQQVVNENIA
jgi:hypothetical protein